MGKKVRISVSLVNVHQRITPVKEDVNNQVDRMTHSVGTGQPLSPATLVTVWWDHEQSGHGGRGGGYAGAQKHGLPLTKVNLGIATAEYPVSQQQRPTLNP
uniref:Uncharacterized protein n=1 Tax=Equus caballus TaxID=9796 RepID=A0A9L0RTY7_HORSE